MSRPSIDAPARLAPAHLQAGANPRRTSRWQLATLAAAGTAVVALLVAGHASAPLPAGSIVTAPASHDAGAGFAPYGPPATAAASTAANGATSFDMDSADCAQLAAKRDSCARVRDLTAILDAAGEPLREDQFGPLVDALSGAQSRLQPPADDERHTPSDAGQKIMRLERDVAEVQYRTAAYTSAVMPLLSREQLKHFERALDEEREARQIELDIARENAGASQP